MEMDPVGTTTAVLELVKTCVAIVLYIKAVKDSPEAKKKIRESIERVEDDLSWIDGERRRIDANSPAVASFDKLLRPSGKNDGAWVKGALLEEVERILEEIVGKLGGRKDKKDKSFWERGSVVVKRVGTTALWPVVEKSIKGKFQELDTVHQAIDRVIRQASFETGQQGLQVGEQTRKGVQDLNVKVDNILLRLDAFDDRNLKDDFSRALQWISPAKLYDPGSGLSEDERMPGDWLVDDDVFQAWFNGGAWSLMLCGEPGFGKTMLSSFVAQYLRRSLPENGSYLVLQLFLKYEEQDSQTFDRLYGLLLKQVLCHQDADQTVHEVVDIWRQQNKSRDDSSRISLDSARLILQDKLAAARQTFIVVDGLDEADGDVQRELVAELKKLQKEIRQQNSTISVLYTSRPGESTQSQKVVVCSNLDCKKSDLKLYYECRSHASHGPDHHLCQSCADKETACDYKEYYENVSLDLKLPEHVIVDYVHKLLNKAKGTGLGVGDGDSADMGVMPNRLLHGTVTLARTLWNLKLDNPEVEAEITKEIVDGIVESSDRSFLMARAQWEHIEEAQNGNEIRKLLTTLPRDPRSIYKNALQRIQENEKPKVARRGLKLLMWLAYSKRVMSFRELEHALIVDLDPFLDPEAGVAESKRSKEIFSGGDALSRLDLNAYLKGTAGMVHMSETGAVRLMHRTAYEFFEDPRNRRKYFPGGGDREIALTCMAYLCHTDAGQACKGEDEESQLDKKLAKLPFAAYASQHWGAHVSSVQDDEEVMTHARNLLNTDSLLAATTQMSSFIDHLQPTGWDVRKGASQTHVAAWFGLHSIIKEYVSADGDVDLIDSSRFGRTPLIYACRNDNPKTIHRLLELGADINRPDGNKELTPIRHAVARGKAKAVLELCRYERLDVNSIRPDDQSSLMVAAQLPTAEVVKALLSAGNINVNLTSSEKGSSALMYSLMNDSTQPLMALLKSANMDVNLQDRRGHSPLQWAAKLGKREAVQKLLAEGADCDSKDSKNGFTALMWAVFGGHHEIAKDLAKHRPIASASDVGHNGWSLLHCACYTGHMATAEWLLDSGVEIDDLDAKGRTALHLAAYMGRTDTVQLLLDKDADRTIRDGSNLTATETARSQGETSIANIIQDSSTAVAVATTAASLESDANGLPITVLARKGHATQLRKLLEESPAKASETDQEGNTALHQAVNHGQEECLQIVLEFVKEQTVIDAINASGLSALRIACKVGRPKMVELLVAHGVKPSMDVVDAGGETALVTALKNGDTPSCEAAMILIGAGASLPPIRIIPQEVLTLAIEAQNVQAVRYLVKNGMNTSYGDRDLAKRIGNETILRILQRNRTGLIVPKETSVIVVAETAAQNEDC